MVFGIALSLIVGIAAQKNLAAPDEIAVALDKAKTEFKRVTETAASKLLAEFEQQKKKISSNKRTKVEDQLKAIEALEDERKAFEKDKAALPQSPGVQKATIEFRNAAAGAKRKVLAAFEKAMEAYRAKGDLTSAKRVLDEKDAFFRNDPKEVDPFRVGAVWDGTRTFQNVGNRGEKHVYRIEITKRTGDRFEGKLTLNGRTENHWKLKGKTTGENFTYEELGNGAYRFVYDGRASGDVITFKFAGKNAMGQDRSGDGRLRAL